MAGVTLCGLYYGMEYFGKDIVNYFILTYIAIGGVAGVRSIMEAVFGTGTFKGMDKIKLLDFKIAYFGLEVDFSVFDLLCLIISGIQMFLYVYTKSWIYNNLICVLFCIHAL